MHARKPLCEAVREHPRRNGHRCWQQRVQSTPELHSSRILLSSYGRRGWQRDYAHAACDAAGQQRLGDAAPRQAARSTHGLLGALFAAFAVPAAARSACGHANASPLRRPALRRARGSPGPRCCYGASVKASRCRGPPVAAPGARLGLEKPHGRPSRLWPLAQAPPLLECTCLSQAQRLPC